jgi:DNA transformation protein and related proteins
MAVSEGHLAFVLDQLAGLGELRSRRMFGGVGLFVCCATRPSGASRGGPLVGGASQSALGGPPGVAEGRADVFFGLIDDGILYLKVDDTTRARYTRRRLKPFAPDGMPSMSYYPVPASILEDADALVVWAREAVAVAQRAAKRPARR